MNHVSPRHKFVDELSTHDPDAYTRFVKANLCNLSVKVPTEEPMKLAVETRFRAEARAYSVGDFTVARIRTSGGKPQSTRSVSDIRMDELRRYTVNLPLSGSVEVGQFGREERFTTGSLVMMSGCEPLTFRRMTDNECIAVAMPQRFVEERLVNVEDICCRRLPSQEGVQRLVFASIATLQEEAASMSEYDLQRAVNIVSELVVLALGNLADVRSSTSPVRAANLMRAKRIIRARCDNSDLTLQEVAVECGLSLRYLHDLFRDDGRTFREYIMYERLQRARRLLEVGSPLTTNVTDVCLSTGFSNLSHFSTAFRRAFSVSPVEVLRHR